MLKGIAKIFLLIIVFYSVFNILFYEKHFAKVMEKKLEEAQKQYNIKFLSVKSHAANEITISNISFIDDEEQLITIREIILTSSLKNRLIFSAKSKEITFRGMSGNVLVIEKIFGQIKETLDVTKILILDSNIHTNLSIVDKLSIKKGSIVIDKNELILHTDIEGRRSDIIYNISYTKKSTTSGDNKLNEHKILLKSDNTKVEIFSDETQLYLKGEGRNIGYLINDLSSNFLRIKEEDSNFKIDIIFNKESNDIENFLIQSDVLDVTLSNQNPNIKNISCNKIITDEENENSINVLPILSLIKTLFNHEFDTKINTNILFSIDNINNVQNSTYFQFNIQDTRLRSLLIKTDLMKNLNILINSGIEEMNNKQYSTLDTKIYGKTSKGLCDLLGIECDASYNDSVNIEMKSLLSDRMTIIPYIGGNIGQSNLYVSGNIKEVTDHSIIAGKITLHNLKFQKVLKGTSIFNYLKYNASNLDMKIDVDFKNLSMPSGTLIEKLMFDVKSTEDGILIRDINYQSEKNDIKGSILIKFHYLNPEFNINFQSNYINISDFTVPHFIRNIDTANEDKIMWNTKQFFSDKYGITDNSIYPAITLNYHIENLNNNEVELLKKANIMINIKDSGSGTFQITGSGKEFTNKVVAPKTLNDDNINASAQQTSPQKIANGSLYFSGILSIKDKIFSFSTSFLLQNITMAKFMNNVFSIQDIDEGLCNISGNLSSKGINMYNIIKNLKGEVRLLATSINIKNFDINQIVRDVPKIKTQNELEGILQISIFNNNTHIRQLYSSHKINKGLLRSEGTFLTKYAAGKFASNMSILNFDINALSILSFQTPALKSDTMSVNMYMKGSVWKPKVYFDNNNIFNFVSQNKLQNVTPQAA
ncbi:hypothetical protein GUI12_01145 [Anaplasmataceae bacterium AB001_6]|nr:hypothetical protein GUI12_01145 [Anaplasmataceae bacterium AB001_6]